MRVFLGALPFLLYRISLGDGRCGPVGFALRLSRRSSIDFPAACDVDSAVFMVLIWLWINPFDLGW